MRRALLVASCVLLPSLSAAQQQPDLNDVLKAIQNLGKEVQGIREDVDKLKRATPPQAISPPAPSASGTASTAQPPPVKTLTGQLRSGWVVSVFNAPDFDRVDFGADAVGVFVHSNSEFNLHLHRKISPNQQPGCL